MTVVENPKVVVRELLAAEWDASNTSGVTPEFRTGWRDSDLAAPQLTVGPEDESPLSDTGFTGFSPDGSGPTATIRGVCQVNAWASHEVTDTNPKQLTDEFVAEARRIVRDHYDISTVEYIDGVENYRYISWFGHDFMPDPPGDPESVVVFRHRAEVRYEYLDRR